MHRLAVKCGIGFATWSLACAAFANGVVPETVATTELGAPAPTWFVVKGGLSSGYVFDAADGEMLGTLSLTPWTPTVRRHVERGEIYAAETHYARRYDGERSDMLRIYAHATLAPVAEIPVPHKIAALHHHYLAILSGGRYVTVFNMTPAQSVSVVDVENRRFVGEISTPGCALTLPAGERGFLMLCGDGTLQWIGLDADGAEAARVRSAPFFSVDDDPLFDQPTQTADGWQFLSYAGLTMAAAVEDGQIVVGESWSVLGEDDEGWRPGGGQPAAFHADHDLLVVLNARRRRGHAGSGRNTSMGCSTARPNAASGGSHSRSRLLPCSSSKARNHCCSRVSAAACRFSDCAPESVNASSQRAAAARCCAIESGVAGVEGSPMLAIAGGFALLLGVAAWGKVRDMGAFSAVRKTTSSCLLRCSALQRTPCRRWRGRSRWRGWRDLGVTRPLCLPGSARRC